MHLVIFPFEPDGDDEPCYDASFSITSQGVVGYRDRLHVCSREPEEQARIAVCERAYLDGDLARFLTLQKFMEVLRAPDN